MKKYHLLEQNEREIKIDEDLKSHFKTCKKLRVKTSAPKNIDGLLAKDYYKIKPVSLGDINVPSDAIIQPRYRQFVKETTEAVRKSIRHDPEESIQNDGKYVTRTGWAPYQQGSKSVEFEWSAMSRLNKISALYTRQLA